MRAEDVADICDWLAAILRRPRHAPARHDQLAIVVGADAHDRRHLVGEDPREQRQIAGSVVPFAKPIADRGLTLGEAVKVAHERRDSGRVKSTITRLHRRRCGSYTPVGPQGVMTPEERH